jgi:hypothetical protein
MKLPGRTAILLGLLQPTVATAQGVDTLRALRTPMAPAFALLGLTPISIERPSTPRAFAVSLLSATQRVSQLPDSWALELAPYWLRSHPRLTYDAYYRPALTDALKQTFSVSIATSARDTNRNTTDLGIGVRTQPLPGRESSQSIAIRRSLSGYQEKITRANLRRRIAERTNQVDSMQAYADTISLYADSARMAAVELQSHQERVGWFVELAGGWTARFPTDSFKGGHTSALGAWATLAYRWEKPRLELVALGRWLDDRLDADEANFDSGARLLWELPRMMVSAEGVFRTPEGGSRITANLEYRVSNSIYLYATYGRDHAETGSQRHPLLALIGLSFEFGDQPRLLR